MTNLEYLVSKEKINVGNCLCMASYQCKYDSSCKDVKCEKCEFVNDIELCVQTLLEEHKEPIKLTLHEKCILESLPNDYKYIARDNGGELYIYKHEPVKHQYSWILQTVHDRDYELLFNHLFKFIKWEDDEPYKIENILNDFEVVENVD